MPTSPPSDPAPTDLAGDLARVQDSLRAAMAELDRIRAAISAPPWSSRQAG